MEMAGDLHPEVQVGFGIRNLLGNSISGTENEGTGSYLKNSE